MLYAQSPAQITNNLGSKGSIVKPYEEANPSRTLVPLDECPICPNSAICDNCNIPIRESTVVRNTLFESRLLLGFKLPVNKTEPIKSCKLQIGGIMNINPISDLPPSSSNIYIYSSTSNFNPSTVTWETMPVLNKELATLDVTIGNIIDITSACIDSINNESDLVIFVLPSTSGPQQLYFEPSTSPNGPKLLIN